MEKITEKQTYRKIIIDGMNGNPAIPYTLDQIVSICADAMKPRIPGKASIQAEVNKMVHLNILNKFKVEKTIVFRLADKYMKRNPFDMNQTASDRIAEAKQIYASALKDVEQEQTAADPQQETAAEPEKEPVKEPAKKRNHGKKPRVFPEYLSDVRITLKEATTMSVEMLVILAIVNRIYEQSTDNPPVITAGTIMVMSQGFFHTVQNLLLYVGKLKALGVIQMENLHGIRVIKKAEA